jgi:DNA (cytosine-5)-methyltransferase 1
VFDGALKAKEEEEFLHGIPFAALSIGNLATLSEHNLNHSIWIQSTEAARAPVQYSLWYELGRPAEEYKNYWEAFEWLALFVKYVSDALEVCVQRKEKVKLAYFRREFAAEIRRLHGGDEVFERWILAFGKGSPT